MSDSETRSTRSVRSDNSNETTPETIRSTRSPVLGSPNSNCPHSPQSGFKKSGPRVLPIPEYRMSPPPSNVGAKRMSFGWFVQQPVAASSTSSLPTHRTSSPVKQTSTDRSTMIHWDYIMRRIQQNNTRTDVSHEQAQVGLRELQQDFAQQRLEGELKRSGDIDWDFWSLVVEDYQAVAREQPERLKNAIVNGFPPGLRSVLWQIISGSSNYDLKEVYETLNQEPDAPCARLIEKDLDRTSMVKHVDTKQLERVLRAYSLFDPEVGYTQGMAFITVPLLLDLNEAHVFSLLVRLMKAYDFRSLYLPEMPGLHLKLHQFDRLIEERVEKVSTHLKRQGVLSTMYASQWFLTAFAYKFPIQLVERVFDMIITEGVEVLLRVALVLMQQNSEKILSLKFEELLPFLHDDIFEIYTDRPGDLVRDVALIDITPSQLAEYELEYQELHRVEQERTEQMDSLRTSNTKLTCQNRQLQTDLDSLNLEHIEIANKMVETGLENATLKDENARLQREIEDLKEELGLYHRASDLRDISKLLSEKEQLTEVVKRLENQVEGLQTALVAAMEEK